MLRLDFHLPKKFSLFASIWALIKVIKIAFYFKLKGLFVLKIFKFLSWLFGHVGKTAWLEIYYVTTCLTSNYSTHNQTMKFGQVIRYNNRNIFLQKSCIKWGRETSFRPLFGFLKSLNWGESKWSVP